MAFQINGGSPPEGGEPVGEGYWFHLAEAPGTDGRNRPVGAVGKPWVEIKFKVCNATVWDWYCNLVSGDDLYVALTSVQTYNPFKSGGADWETFSGSGITMRRPTYEHQAFGQYYGVRIVIENLS